MQSRSSGIRFGSEVYTWFMKENGRANANRLDHMIEVIAAAGFTGIQPIFSWMGDLNDPFASRSLASHGTWIWPPCRFVLDWNHEGETEEELREAEVGYEFSGTLSGCAAVRGPDAPGPI